MIFNLHLANDTSPPTFGEKPNLVFLAVRVSATPEGDIPVTDISVEHFVNLSALSPELRKKVVEEIQANNLPEISKNKPLWKTEPVGLGFPGVSVSRRFTPEDSPKPEEVFRVDPKTVLHKDLESYLEALADCRAGTGDVLSCDNPKNLRIGFVHHPDEGDSFLHEIPLRAIKSTTPSEQVASRLGVKAEDVRGLLSTVDGRNFLVTGKPPEPESSPEQDALLAEAMMADFLKAEVLYDEDRLVSVEFPDYNLGMVSNLVRVAGLVNPAPHFREFRKRPDWLPEGWSVLRLPEDEDRVGVQEDLSPVGAQGIFARRADRLFRAFEDGRWDASQWVPPILDNRNQETVPGGYKVYRAGHVGKPDLLAAFEGVLPEYNLTPSALVRV